MVQLQHENEDLRKAPKALSVPLHDANRTGDQIEKHEKNLPALKPPDRCWFGNQFEIANPTVKEAVTATAVVIHCNHKVDAPYEVLVRFDTAFIPGSVTVLDDGVLFVDMGVEGLVLKVTMNPSLLADQTLVVTVYGPTKQYPRAGSVTINSVK